MEIKAYVIKSKVGKLQGSRVQQCPSTSVPATPIS